MAKDLYYIAQNWDNVDDEAHEYFKKCLIQFSQDYEINNYEIEVTKFIEDEYKIYKKTEDYISEIGYLFNIKDNNFEKNNLYNYCDLCKEILSDDVFYYSNYEKDMDICQTCEVTIEGQEFIKENELTI